MGFLACLYCCNEISVMSRGAKEALGSGFQASTEDLLNHHQAKVDELQMEPGTRVALSSFQIPVFKHVADVEVRIRTLASELMSLVKGFPLPVTFNGVELERPDAINADFAETAVGGIFLKLESWRHYKLYLQGLPVESEGAQAWDCSVIHLNSSFVAKAPDRTHLTDPANDRVRVRRAIDALARDRIIAIKASVEPAEFVLNHADMCRKWGFRDLLNDIDLVPGSWFVDWKSQAPGFAFDWEEDFTLDGVLTRDQLTMSRVYGMPDEFDMKARSWLAAGPHFTFQEHGAVDKGHWLSELVDHVNNDQIEIIVKGQKGTQVVDTWNGGEVLLVAESVELRHVTTKETYGVDAVYDGNMGTLSTSVGARPSKHTRLITNYSNDSDQYMESAESADGIALNKAHAEVLATDPAQLLTIMLRGLEGLGGNVRLSNTAFMVTFDEQGNFKEVVATQ